MLVDVLVAVALGAILYAGVDWVLKSTLNGRDADWRLTLLAYAVASALLLLCLKLLPQRWMEEGARNAYLWAVFSMGMNAFTWLYVTSPERFAMVLPSVTSAGTEATVFCDSSTAMTAGGDRVKVVQKQVKSPTTITSGAATSTSTTNRPILSPGDIEVLKQQQGAENVVIRRNIVNEEITVHKIPAPEPPPPKQEVVEETTTVTSDLHTVATTTRKGATAGSTTAGLASVTSDDGTTTLRTVNAPEMNFAAAEKGSTAGSFVPVSPSSDQGKNMVRQKITSLEETQPSTLASVPEQQQDPDTSFVTVEGGAPNSQQQQAAGSPELPQHLQPKVLIEDDFYDPVCHCKTIGRVLQVEPKLEVEQVARYHEVPVESPNEDKKETSDVPPPPTPQKLGNLTEAPPALPDLEVSSGKKSDIPLQDPATTISDATTTDTATKPPSIGQDEKTSDTNVQPLRPKAPKATLQLGEKKPNIKHLRAFTSEMEPDAFPDPAATPIQPDRTFNHPHCNPLGNQCCGYSIKMRRSGHAEWTDVFPKKDQSLPFDHVFYMPEETLKKQKWAVPDKGSNRGKTAGNFAVRNNGIIQPKRLAKRSSLPFPTAPREGYLGGVHTLQNWGMPYKGTAKTGRSNYFVGSTVLSRSTRDSRLRGRSRTRSSVHIPSPMPMNSGGGCKPKGSFQAPGRQAMLLFKNMVPFNVQNLQTKVNQTIQGQPGLKSCCSIFLLAILCFSFFNATQGIIDMAMGSEKVLSTLNGIAPQYNSVFRNWSQNPAKYFIAAGVTVLMASAVGLTWFPFKDAANTMPRFPLPW